MKNHSVFSKENADIWITVYGGGVVIGLLLLIFGGHAWPLGALLIVGVLGSFLTISAVEAFHNWLDRKPPTTLND